MGNPEIAHYYSIVDNDPYELDRRIAERISIGWQPFGGICMVSHADGDISFAQAVVKYRKQQEVSNLK